MNVMYTFSALVALPALVAPSMAADLSTPQGVFDEQMAILGEFGDILASQRSPEEMAAAIDALAPRSKAIVEAAKSFDENEMKAIVLANKEKLQQVIAKLIPGVMKISMDPNYASNEALRTAMENFSGAPGGAGEMPIEDMAL